MSKPMRICFTGLLLAVTACVSAPLPEGTIPTEFFFEYERERPEGADPAPTFLSIQIDNSGEISYEVQHVQPRRARKSGETSLTQKDFERLYEEIRRADLFQMEERYAGDDEAFGKETFWVTGQGNRDKMVTADGIQVDKLDNLREVMLSILPVEEILGFPREAFEKVVMDKRTGETFPANHPLVETVPEEFRAQYRNWWQALNAGGWPSEKVDVPQLK